MGVGRWAGWMADGGRRANAETSDRKVFVSRALRLRVEAERRKAGKDAGSGEVVPRQQGAIVLCRTPHQCVLALSRLITGTRCLLACGSHSTFLLPSTPAGCNTGATGAYCFLRCWSHTTGLLHRR